MVQELVDGFMNARPSILQLARNTQDNGAVENQGEEAVIQPTLKKRKIEQETAIDGANGIAEEGVRTRSQSRGVAQQTQAEPIEIIDDVQDEEYVPGMYSLASIRDNANVNTDDGLVACPICAKRMKNEAVFRHLDTCTGESEPTPPSAFG